MWEYVKGFCPKSHYFCLMPVKYEKEDDGKYHKQECRCYLVEKGECNDGKSCEHFKNADETMPLNKLMAKRYGE